MDKKRKFDLSSTNIYTDYIEMLRNEKPDLVAICTESGKHASIAMECIDEGINVIIEKPMALSLMEARGIIIQSEMKGVKVCVSHQNRLNKSIRKIKEAVEKGRFGRLFYGTAHIRWSRDWEYYSRAKWRGTWDQDGGALMNQCIHNIDILRWMMGGEIDEVVGMTDRLKHDYIQAEDFGIALIRFKNNSYGIIEGTTDIYPKNLEETLYIFGEKGTAKAGGVSLNKIEEWAFSDRFDNRNDVIQKFSEEVPNIYGFGHTPLYLDMVDSIENDRKPLVSAQDGYDALELVLAIYKSAFENKTIRLPLDECSTLEFKGRFE